MTEAAGPLRLVVFDFDQTLTTFHVFKALAGWSSGLVPAPHATTEEGQLCRIEELNRNEFSKSGGFARAAFGGASRVEEVRSMLNSLRTEGAELIVCTKGLVGAVKKCLQDLELLQYFSEVYGRVGSEYGALDYDRQRAAGSHAEHGALLGRVDQASWGTKDKLISALMRERNLQFEECALVEDDPDEIQRARPFCRTLFVEAARGLTPQHNATLLRWALVPGALEGEGAGRTGRPAKGWLCIVM